MIEPIDEFDSLADLEALLCAAGGYVKPSEDLRPRVIESARAARGERRVRRRLRGFFFTLLLCLLCADVLDGPLKQFAIDPRAPGRIVDAEDLFRLSESRADHPGNDSAWGLVEAFNEMRQQQLQSFRPAM